MTPPTPRPKTTTARPGDTTQATQPGPSCSRRSRLALTGAAVTTAAGLLAAAVAGPAASSPSAAAEPTGASAAAATTWNLSQVRSTGWSTSRTSFRMSSSGIFTQRVESAPLAPNSATVANNLYHQVADHYGGLAAFNDDWYNVAYYKVDPGYPRVNVGYWNCQGIYPREAFTGAKHFMNVPVPRNAVPAVGSDGEMTLYDPSTDQLWEFAKMRKNANTGAWEACWGGRIDRVSTTQGIHVYPYGATATGITMTGGMVSLADVRKGSIDHALYLSVREAQKLPNISWPATRGDGQSSSTGVVMQGQRVRLDPSLDLSKYSLTPIGRMVAVAAQKYGFIVVDKGGAVAVITESGQLEQLKTGVNPWSRLYTGKNYNVLAGFPWNKLQVIRKDWGKP